MIPRSIITRLRPSESVRARGHSIGNVFFSHLTVLAAVENGLVCGAHVIYMWACGLPVAAGHPHKTPRVYTHASSRAVGSFCTWGRRARVASQACAGCFGEAREGIARWKRQEGRERRVEKKERTSFFSLSLLFSLPSFPFPSSLFIRSVRRTSFRSRGFTCDPRLYVDARPWWIVARY